MSDSFWQRWFRGARRIRRQPEWDLCAGPDWVGRIMAANVTDDFHAKQGRSTGRWVLKAQGRDLVVYLKRHYRLPWYHGLLAAVWPEGEWSPAFQEWRRLELARAQGLPVPEALAAAEYIGPWGRLQSFLAVRELSGMVPLHQAIPAAADRLDASEFRTWKRGLVTELARLIRELHGRCWFHKDLYLCHFFIPADVPGTSWQGRVSMIDLHRLGHHPWTGPLWQVKDLGQLLYSSNLPGIEARDRLLFWRAYLGAGRRTRRGRWLRLGILAKWGRYRRHNEKRKQRQAVKELVQGASNRR